MSGVELSGRRSGYSDTASDGRVVVLAGQVADPEVIAAGGGFVAEFASALGRLTAALAEAGGRPGDLLQIRIFVTDMTAYVEARPGLGAHYRRCLQGHFPATTLVEVGGLLHGAQVELDGLATCDAASQRGRTAQHPEAEAGGAEDAVEEAVIRLRLAPSDARYAGQLAAGSKAMEIFADLETELALREGGDEGLCVAYDMVEFLAPLHAGDFVEGRARVVERGRSSRRVAAEIYRVLEVDGEGVLRPQAEPVLAARASATIVVGRTAAARSH
jgi:3-aminobutyryl-CoA ammonia-lyase